MVALAHHSLPFAPTIGLGAVRLTDGFRGTQAGMFGSHLRAAELPRMTSREVLMAVY